MKKLGGVIVIIAAWINWIFVCLLILSAYSYLFDPHVDNPFSCFGLAFPIFLIINICFVLFWLIVFYKYALISVIGFIVCISQIQTYFPIHFKVKDIPENSIKILSYNVMAFNNLAKEDGKNPILTFLAESNADIICLQEYSSSTNKKTLTENDINKALKAYRYHTVIYPVKGGSGLATFSKYPILSSKVIKYNTTFNGSVLHHIAINGDTATLINNHFESNKLTHKDKELYVGMIKDPNKDNVKTGFRQLIKKLSEASVIRSSQADSVAKAIDDSKYPTIIACGDFNDASISYTHHVLTEKLNDAYTESGCGIGASYNQNMFYFRIDNILISPNLKAYNCTIDRSLKDSDHYPIWCYVDKRKK